MKKKQKKKLVYSHVVAYLQLLYWNYSSCFGTNYGLWKQSQSIEFSHRGACSQTYLAAAWLVYNSYSAPQHEVAIFLRHHDVFHVFSSSI